MAASVFKKRWYLFALIAITLLSFGLNFFAIGKVGYGNAYYAAAIKSMTGSFTNFFYVAFDPSGFVSVDKPPLGLWVQALFVLVFGYHGWAMLLPQALAATGSCIMMYVLVSKHFGRPAGLLSALVFALTPAVVVAARNNTIDTELVLVLLSAAWFLFKSIETSKWRYLFLCAVFVGLGFNIKMLEAYMILPAVVIVYLIFDRHKFIKRVAAGAIGLVLMLAVSSAWVLAVDLTPPQNRPYVDSTANNKVSELIIGHNGLERLFGSGSKFNPGLSKTSSGKMAAPSSAGTAVHVSGQHPYSFGVKTSGGLKPKATQKSGVSGAPSFGAGLDPYAWQNVAPWISIASGTANPGIGNGSPGVFRLWDHDVFGQASWLIVLALFCVIAIARKFKLKDLTVKQAVFVFWLVWLVTMWAFFSFARLWHVYYLCIAAPGIAGLVGIGFPEMVRAFRLGRSWRQFLLPAALIGTFAVEFSFVWQYDGLRKWLAPSMLVSAAVSLLMMAACFIKLVRLKTAEHLWKKLITGASSALMLISLLIAPIYWSLTAVLYVEQNSTLPYAGPELAQKTYIPSATLNQEVLTNGDPGTVALEKYLVAHYKPGSYLVVAQRANDVAQFIVDTGLPAVAYGGFLGEDNALTLDRLKELVGEGKITYFLITRQSSMYSDISNYVRENAALIPVSDYQGDAFNGTYGSAPGGISGSMLFLFS